MSGALPASPDQVQPHSADSRGKDSTSYFRATKGKNLFQRFVNKLRNITAESRAADRRLAEATAHAWLVLAQVEQERHTAGGHH